MHRIIGALLAALLALGAAGCASGMKVRAVGMIADPAQAEAILAEGKADLVAMARAFLDNPRWVWHAAERYGVKLDYPPQYARARPDVWPGSRLARPG